MVERKKERERYREIRDLMKTPSTVIADNHTPTLSVPTRSPLLPPLPTTLHEELIEVEGEDWLRPLITQAIVPNHETHTKFITTYPTSSSLPMPSMHGLCQPL